MTLAHWTQVLLFKRCNVHKSYQNNYVSMVYIIYLTFSAHNIIKWKFFCNFFFFKKNDMGVLVFFFFGQKITTIPTKNLQFQQKIYSPNKDINVSSFNSNSTKILRNCIYSICTLSLTHLQSIPFSQLYSNHSNSSSNHFPILHQIISCFCQIIYCLFPYLIV